MWFTAKQCDQKTCEKTLHDLNQVKKATGKYQSDVALMLLSSNNKPASKDFISWLDTRNVLHASMTNPKLAPNSIYLVDPHGFIMMRYEDRRNPHDIYKDLSKLLRLTNA